MARTFRTPLSVAAAAVGALALIAVGSSTAHAQHGHAPGHAEDPGVQHGSGHGGGQHGDRTGGGHGHGDASGHQPAAHGDAHGGGHGDAHALHAPAPINWTSWDFKNKDAHGGTLEPGEEPMGPPLAFALFNFAVFIGLLFWKAGPPIRKWLDSRHSSIKEALEEAAVLRKQARDKLESYDKRIADVNSEVEALIGEIRAEAEAEKKRILEQAEHQAEAMKKAAQERIEAEVARARQTLEREVVTAAVNAAERILRDKTTSQDHRTLVSSFITDLAQAPTDGTGPRQS